MLKSDAENKGFRYNEFEVVIEDLKNREAQLRQVYEKEITKDREKQSYLQSDIEVERKQYADLKAKMKQKNNMLEQEVIDLKDVIEGKDREISKLKRAQDRLKRDLRMTKEEISILGGAAYNN